MILTSNCAYIPRMRLMYPAFGGVVLSVYEDDPVYAQQESYAASNDGSAGTTVNYLISDETVSAD